jgi:uncharacterized repeat protein (TIGR03803 family)
VHGNWTKTILHNLKDVAGGEFPESGIVLDAAGNLYGTTNDGGTRGSGVVFQLAPGANGKWTYRAIFLFDGLSGGALPSGGVILDASGTLYGTTFRGRLFRTRLRRCFRVRRAIQTHARGRGQMDRDSSVQLLLQQWLH